MKYRTKKRNRLSGSQKRKRNSIRGAEWHKEIVAREKQEAWQEGWAKGRDLARRMEEAEG